MQDFDTPSAASLAHWARGHAGECGPELCLAWCRCWCHGPTATDPDGYPTDRAHVVECGTVDMGRWGLRCPLGCSCWCHLPDVPPDPAPDYEAPDPAPLDLEPVRVGPSYAAALERLGLRLQEGPVSWWRARLADRAGRPGFRPGDYQ